MQPYDDNGKKALSFSASLHHTVSSNQRLLKLDAHSFSFVSPITEKLAFKTTDRFSLGSQLGHRDAFVGKTLCPHSASILPREKINRDLKHQDGRWRRGRHIRVKAEARPASRFTRLSMLSSIATATSRQFLEKIPPRKYPCNS